MSDMPPSADPGLESRSSGPVIAMLAGEDSGDQLGSDLIDALRAIHPDAHFVGVGGPFMRQAGFDAWYDISELSVMGLAEVLRHLPRLLRLRASLTRRLLALKPDVFVGIDAPDFNLGLERRLKRAGIRTVHYVSPSIWAWREQRAAKIGASADRVLCLFPMEPGIYEKYGVDARFVGHPLADRFPLVNDRAAARSALELPQDVPVLALLPGSRLAEVRRLGAIFLQAAARIRAEIPNLRIVIPAANKRCLRAMEGLLASSGLVTRNAEAGCRSEHRRSRWLEGRAAGAASFSGLEKAIPTQTSRTSTDPDSGKQEPGTLSLDPFPSPEPRVPCPVLLLDGQSHRAMTAADVVLLASGTAALEAMLAKRPMVVAYRIATLTYRTVRGLRMLKTDLFSLPNVLAAHRLVPELMQEQCTAENLATEMLRLFREPARRELMVGAFERMHLSLHAGGGGAAAAARAIDELLPAR